MTTEFFPQPYKYPKILLTGATGQVGWELHRSLRPLGNIWAPIRQEFDLADPESLRNKIRDYRPSLIVNPAAYTAVDQAESESELAHVINTEAPKILAEEAHNLGIPLIHYSTDYVFDGSKNEPYTEHDEPNPLNVYGRTKLEGERAIQASHDQYLILRTSWIYSPDRGKNFYTTMQQLFHEKEEIKVVDDQIGAPTSARFLGETTAQIISQLKAREEGEHRWGLYHLRGHEFMSWHGFATKIFEKIHSQSSTAYRIKYILPISSCEYPTIARRPRNSKLSNDLIISRFVLDLPDKEDCARSSRQVF